MFVCVCALTHAQTDTIRYVHPNGVYSNDGLSWATATNKLQDAINDLRDYLKKNNLSSGSVYVAAGTYVPTESTESSGGSMLNTSFKIYSGIHVYGGFNPASPESRPGLRVMSNDKVCEENWANQGGVGTTSGVEIASQWDLKYKTILSGNHSSSDVVFTYDPVRGRFNTTYPANSYHVVWFATNGKYETGNDSTAGHYRPLTNMASVNGCVIAGGNASSRNTTTREHTAYGGGVYMVGNSELRNCIVERCNATLRGGGIYMDGGGVAEFCYVHTCQSTGVGVVQGYGGGVCIEHDGSIGHSHITNCAARCGGGLLIYHVKSEYPADDISYYSPYATACVINNNTAASEGGGIYLAEGGTINHCTVTANNCIGPDVTYYGRRHGRTGGIYVRNGGMIFNSVFWGNRCETNNDIQFASVRQNTDEGHEVFAYHTAFMNHDITDWTGVAKEMVFSLEKNNYPNRTSSGNHPCFFAPTVDPANWDNTSPTAPGPGVFQTMRPEDFPGPRIWHLTSYSALDQKGVQANQTVTDASPWLLHSHTDYGVVTNPFEPVSTLGALVRKIDPIKYALVPPQGVEGRLGGDPIPTLFIDPNRKGVYDEDGHLVEPDQEGHSWDAPIKEFGEAITYFRQYLEDDPGNTHHYYMPKLNAEGDTVKTDGKVDSVRYDYIQILVKEGTLTTVGPGNYLDGNIRSAAVRVESHMRLYGGYPSSLTGTDTDGRNPRDYVTNISANITGVEGARGYENNSAHVVSMVNVEHTIIDGFTLSDANTHNVFFSHSAHAGGGVLINNANTPQEKRIHMTGNQLRNCVISNCTSPKGAAVYVNGEHMNADGYVCYAELKMVNCVVRNNTADYEDNDHHLDDHGIITANGRAYIEMEHCDVVNNVGYPFKADNKKTDSDEPITCTHPEHSGHAFHGFIRVNNSIIFCNGAEPWDERTELGKDTVDHAVLSVFSEGQEYVFGEHNMFDEDIKLLQRDDHMQPHGFFNPDFSYTVPTDFIPSTVSFSTTFGASLLPEMAPLPSDKKNVAIFTRNDPTAATYPTFVNPSRNVGNSPAGDKPLYGGTVSYEPLTTNPCVNAAGSDYADAENYDRTDNCMRDRGGAPDIGAIENGDLPAAGAVIYVTPDGAGKRDGSSWSNAIAGNTVYRLYGAPAADGDSIDAASDARLINKSSHEPVLTTDTRYCGGFSRLYEYPMFRDIKKNRTTTIERNVYVGGANDGLIDTISISSPSNSTTTGTWYLNGTIPDDGSYDPTLAMDPRYPYGEMSGNSRAMYRAAGNISPIDESGSYTVTIAKKTAPGVVASGQLLVTNDRRENYVSGLQYAVEKASALNKTMHQDSIQVWVGAGKYTDYKGYVMRDSVSVYGGFPAGKFSAPGMSERQALMSAVVSIPKSAENADLDAEDYETILQISDVNPKKNNTTIEPTAIKFKDDSAAVKWQFNLYTYDTITTTTSHYYRWLPGRADVSDTYMLYPDMYNSVNSSNIFDKDKNRHKTDKTGAATEGGWTWGASEKYVYQYWGTKSGGNNSWEMVYANRTNNVDYTSFKFDGSRNVINADGEIIGTVSHGMQLTGGMSKMSVWQTMKNVPEGDYQLEIDLAAFYRQTGGGHGYDVEEENTGVTFYIIASDGTTLAEQPIFVKNTTAPYKLRRYSFDFSQPATGDLTIRLMSVPGTKTTDPAALNSAMPALNDNLNRREVMMANVHLYSVGGSSGDYVLDYDGVKNVSTGSGKKTTVTKDPNWKKLARTTLRKRVLFMPDVTNPVYAHGLGNPTNRGTLNDNLAHYERTTKPERKSNASGNQGKHDDPNYVEYNNVYWDGFTIRHGFIIDQCMSHGGGAGVAMYEGGHIANCVITDNWAGAHGMKGGGVFVDGSNAVIENCFILNNTSTTGKTMDQSQLFAGGLFLYEGTCFNSLIANNYAHGFGGGLGLCVGKFYNNTLAYNTGAFKNDKSGNKTVGGLRIATGADPAILMANTIIYGNSGLAIDMTASSDFAPFLNCYIQSTDKITKTSITHAINPHADGSSDGNYGIGNAFYNGQAAQASTTPFGADVNAGGEYTGDAQTNNDFALRQVDGIRCINSGSEDFAATLEEALAVATTTAIPDKTRAVYRAAVAGVELPKNDVVYAKRVQDCQVDIGAYEFNAAFNISPDTTSHPGKAIFYISFDSPGGDASSRSPENAACRQKLQLVLDAAGRYKYNLMTLPRYSSVAGTPVAGSPDKSWTVEVWLEGDSVNSRLNDEYAASYTPTRSTKHSIDFYHDNTLDYSFIVPHGIQVKGGYKPGFWHMKDEQVIDDRDPLTYRTVLSGQVVSSTGAKGQTFHVVTFTNDLFDVNEYVKEDGGQLAVFSALPDAENHRAVLDGLFIMDGYANSPDKVDCIGAGAVVTDYAHVRNCVIQKNIAKEYGGGLYLKPSALVSGTIIKNNSAEIGGGIYIEAPASLNTDSLAHVYTSTICQNSAVMSAGGMWFDNTYARVNSTALWHNTANDNANVSGIFSRTSSESDYPLNFCAVESRRLEGQGNIELSPKETEAVRWDHEDPFDAILYYPIEMSSTLSRAGMTYGDWNATRAVYTTLDSLDIAGVHRARWTVPGVERGFAWGTDTLVKKKNDFIEIGARAINKNYEINVNQEYIMRRIYVMRTELIASDAARALQDNTLDNDTANMYRQMGSCALNPFHRLGDAFDYIIAARKSDPATYRNVRFEVYIEQGTYYPSHNAYGEQDKVRMNTFLIPEATSVVGGINSKLPGHNYCQAGYADRYTNTLIGNGEDITVRLAGGGSYTLHYAPADSIRKCDSRHRPMRDYNLNSVIEPWEFERQTILSGNAVSGDDFTHIYHVITAHADSTIVGPQPLRYRTDNYDTNYAHWKEGKEYPLLSNPIMPNDDAHFEEECDLSIAARSIILDGLQITGGYANHLDPADTVDHQYLTKTYFRGGGIFIDGNWRESFDDTDPSGIPNVTQPAKYNIPLVVRNSQFTDNMAGNGGGIYSNGDIHIYSCHFTQNYSQGPMTALDQKFIPWTAGGCIATNAYCGVINTLFDNNEARRGLYPIDVASESERIPDADARQGFGGVLSVAAQSRMRVSNCHFMKNKAVAYSAIYNFLANNHYSTADSMQFAFNSIFWGNEVFEVDNIGQLEHKVAPSAESINAFNTKYKASRAGVFHYDGDAWAHYELHFHEYDSLYNHYVALGDTFNVKVTDKLAELRAVADSVEGLYFCSYRQTYGPTGMKPTAEGYLMTRDEQRAYVDSRQLPVLLKTDEVGDRVEDYHELFSYVHGNNNVLINKLNTATDGPNFKQPSFVAGIDGYMQNADWLLGRMNLTTDQGWGHLRQRVDRAVSYYITKYTGKTHFETAEEALAAAIAEEPSATERDVYPILGTPSATFDGVAQSEDPAMYNFLSKRAARHTLTTPRVPVGSQHYMEYTNGTAESEATGEMYRISPNPRIGVSDVYIDMGIYEYQYIQLDIKGNEIDTLWVATKTKDPVKHDGLSWETPTTDLQGAIDLLMSSHNNHDKYICLMGDAEQHFAPSNVLDNRRAFVITSNTLAPLLPDSAMADYDYGVRSLTFLGGYSFDVKDAPRDPQANPTVIEMPDAGNRNQLNQLVVVEDMTRQMVQANWLGHYTSRDSVVIPIVFDGITFINPFGTRDPGVDGYTALGGTQTGKGGAAIYYRWQRQYEDVGGTFYPNFNMVLYPDSTIVDNRKVELPKLTISNCVFMDCGDHSADVSVRTPALRVGYGGGSSLIVNSLFHSNAGAPIYGRRKDDLSEDVENNFDQVHNAVIIVNSTFALNGGHLRLGCEHSQVHNSIIWQDDLASDTLVQLQIGDGVNEHIYDKNTHKNDIGYAGVSNNAVWGCFQAGDESYHNDPLTTANRDILRGPNFIAPDINASTSEARRARSFRLNPGIRTMNMADTTLYRSLVFFREYPDETLTPDENYWRRSNGFKSTLITTLANDSDLAAKPRLCGIGMERGAYECQAVLQRVLYVQPNLPAATAGDGSSWQSPFGQGQMQNALDAAAVYTYLNRFADAETRKAYVFVKGSYDAMDRNDLEARDGVSVFGSLPNSFNDTAYMNKDLMEFTNAECQRFVNYVRAVTTGVASPDATPTRIHSLTVDGEDYEIGFLLDGFVISNPGTTLNSAPVVLNNHHTALRNCVITDNKVDGAPVVDLRHGLLYNSLLYNDSADALVKVGANGLVLNNTILASHEEVEPVDDSEAAEGAVQNTLRLNGQRSPVTCFAPYLTPNTPYVLPSYLSSEPVLAYQLHEQSAEINGGTNTLPALFNDHIADSVICFWRDRDLLGNPRRIGGTVDMGALETWRIEPGTVVEMTALTNEVMDTRITTSDDATLRAAFKTHYGGNSYPHPGSVVYLMDSSAITMQYATANDFKDFRNNDIIFRPGYMLLKSGASFYGNGHEVQMSYLAAEKRFINQRYSMTAFPFNYNTGHITTPATATGTLSLVSADLFSTYQYSGAARSQKDYAFQTTNSSLWLPVDTLNRTATEGYLMDFGEALDTVLRFTTFAPVAGQYVYTEENMDKTVWLTQYDNRVAGSGAELNFTRQEDMGWNMKGLPWLVSNYRTDTILAEGNFQRQMFIPHVFYYMDGAGEDVSAGDQMLTARSWDRGAVMSMGTAFFTQTATTASREGVVFHLPYYGMNEKAARPILRMSAMRRQPAAGSQRSMAKSRQSIHSDFLTVIPNDEADKQIRYTYGKDGMKWLTNEDNAQVYLLDSKRQSRISLLDDAPTETDIPLGVQLPENYQQAAVRFRLPEKEAFARYAYVWLIDYAQNRMVNLLDEDYEAELESGQHNQRFALRIGGFPMTDENGRRRYLVFAHDGTLYVRGLITGDRISVYAPSGQKIRSDVAASAAEWTMPLSYRTGYIVSINNTAYKVLNR